MAYLSVAVDIQVISTWDSLVYRVPTTFVYRINAIAIPRLCERHDHKWKYTMNKQLKRNADDFLLTSGFQSHCWFVYGFTKATSYYMV